MKLLFEVPPFAVVAQHDGMTFLLTKRPDYGFQIGSYVDHRGNVQEVLHRSVYGEIAAKLLEGLK